MYVGTEPKTIFKFSCMAGPGQSGPAGHWPTAGCRVSRFFAPKPDHREPNRPLRRGERGELEGGVQGARA